MSDQPKPEVSELVKEIAEAIAEALIPNATKDEINWISQIISTSGLATLEHTKNDLAIALRETLEQVVDLKARLETAERHVEDVQACLTWKVFKKMEGERDEARGRLKEIADLSKDTPAYSPDPLCPKTGYVGLAGIEQAEVHRLATDTEGRGDG